MLFLFTKWNGFMWGPPAAHIFHKKEVLPLMLLESDKDPLRFDRYQGIPPYLKPMTILVWNCRGAKHHDFVPIVHIMWITETKVCAKKVRKTVDKLPFDAWIDTTAIHCKGRYLAFMALFDYHYYTSLRH